MAVKVMSDLRSDSPHAEAIQREMKLGPRLADHPGIVAVRNVERVNGVLHLEMDWVQGPSLEHVLDGRIRTQAGPLPTSLCVSWMADVLDTLHWACNTLAPEAPDGFVHRDIKPANLLISEAGVIRVSDFGMALASTEFDFEQTDTRTVKGTPRFMAPEALREQTIDARADQFSVGAVLYEMLTLKPLYRGASMHEVLALALTADVEAALQEYDGPPRVATVLHRLLSADPDHRYLTHASAADALRNLDIEGPEVGSILGQLLDAALGPEPSESWPRVPLPTLHNAMFRDARAGSGGILATFDDEDAAAGPRVSRAVSTFDDTDECALPTSILSGNPDMLSSGPDLVPVALVVPEKSKQGAALLGVGLVVALVVGLPLLLLVVIVIASFVMGAGGYLMFLS
jgi:serine/threonine protein kinase